MPSTWTWNGTFMPSYYETYHVLRKIGSVGDIYSENVFGIIIDESSIRRYFPDLLMHSKWYL